MASVGILSSRCSLPTRTWPISTWQVFMRERRAPSSKMLLPDSAILAIPVSSAVLGWITIIPYQGFYPIPPDLRTTEQFSWNLGIQRQVTPSLFTSATYVGTHLIHTWSNIDLNPARFIAGNCAAGQFGLTAAGPCSTASN